MTRKLETYITPQTDREWPADHPLRKATAVAGSEQMKKAHLLICRRASDPPPDDIATATEFPGWCPDCGEAIIHRALPNPDVKLICIYCWAEMKGRGP